MVYTGDSTNHKMITWRLNEQCNFRCDYCWEPHDIKPTQKIDVVNLLESLKYLEDDWIFYITGGGEPFLEKNFIEICCEITKRHSMAVYTNLSTENVYDFADTIDPVKCISIYAAVHISEREKKEQALAEYIKKILYLQKKGFHVVAYYLAYPPLFERIKSDIDFIKSRGIQNVRLKVFNGMYQGKYYPYSFNDEQKNFLKSFEADDTELALLDRPNVFYRQLCLAGQKSLIMDRLGNLTRCHSSLKKHGNLFEKKVILDDEPKPCPKLACECTPEGLKYALPEKGNLPSVIKENLIEQSLILKEKGTKTWLRQSLGMQERDGVPMKAIKEIQKKHKH